MTLVEGIACECFPVAPDLVENLWVVAVLLSAFNELGLHGVNDVLFLLTHGLSQGVAFTSGEVGQQTAQ